MSLDEPNLDLSPKVSDEIRKTTCYMCACRCGINVHMKQAELVDQPWTSLAEAWPDVVWTRNALAAAIVSEVVEIIAQFERQGFAPFRDEWQARDIFFSKDLVARDGGVEGRGAGIDAAGNYQVDTPEGLVPVRAGDISLRVRS